MERGGYRGGYKRGRGRGGGGGGRGVPPQSQSHQWQRTNPSSSSSTQTRSPSGSSNPPPRPTSRPFQAPPQTLTQPNIGALNISDQSIEKIAPVRRPDQGGTLAIRKCRLRVNHFPVTFNPQSIIMHYNVDVKTVVPPKNGHQKKISKFDLSLIRDKLFSDHADRFPLLKTAYDGDKNIFSAVLLPEETFTVDVSRGEDEKGFSYAVTLTLVNKLELRKLKEYLSGNVLSIPRDVLQGMDLVVKENPAKRTVSLGRCFFPTNPPSVERDLQPGIIAIGGFQQSLKTTSNGLALCLDYSVLSFRKKMSVLDFLHAHIQGFNLSEFGKFRKNVEEALIGLKVNVTHRRTKQKYTITKLTTNDTRHITFNLLNPEDQNATPTRTTLLAYFQEKYEVDVKYKDIPSLDFGGNKMNYVPMELCVLVEGQRYPKEYLGKNASKTLKDMSLARPRDRESIIQMMVKSGDGPNGGGILQNFGMNINTSMTNVTGRVIGPPQLKLGKPNGEITGMTLDPEKCQWNLVGKSMVEGKPVECWGILDFTCRGPKWCRLRDDEFVPKLMDKYGKLGIHMSEPVWYEESAMSQLGNFNSLCELLKKINDNVQKRCRRQLQFLLCVMTNKDQGYKSLKLIAETKVGIVTQCCLSGNANEGKDQYLTNLALKINAKIGGSNVELINRLPHFKGDGHVMFIGADVNHPASRDTNSPSIAAVVATTNWPAASRYAARVCAQNHRTEKILNFGEVCLDLVTYYERLNKVRPEKIVIFRDGVSESQFHMVLAEELQDLKTVFRRSNYSPTITLIVAQKRHQTRLFPAGPKEGTPSGNVFPGTVVDTNVVHPFEFDFYLCSHYGSLGTSKPTHYHVLWDEHKITSDDLQKLIYDMCFTFARCTKPVSLVPPVYYADLAAYRGRLYYEARIGVQSPVSSASSSTVSNFNDPGAYKLHPNMENVMFFV